MTIIDAHSHLWLKQDTVVDGNHLYTTTRGRSMFFDGERQMLPPFMVDGKNTAEIFLANMDYAQVGGAVVVQEVIDGYQNDYLLEVSKKYPDRFFVCGMPRLGLENAEAEKKISADDILNDVKALYSRGFKGIAIPGHRISRPMKDLLPAMKYMEEKQMIFSMCLADNANQIATFHDVISECKNLKIAIGHFGLATTKNWKNQILLARNPNVFIESGGITWLYNSEFYPFPSAVKAIREAADLVGIDKLMWGSDYPRTICAITYKMSYDFIIKSNAFTNDEKAAFLGENAVKLYGFKNLPELPYIKNMSE
ncbi:MAG: amidohydrolase family protein [Bacteroidales bacterium]|nr:amidohydrolase family protein [Bacteroidales bacterium]